ncbi:hypothetical protein ABFY47_25625 [Enterobacter ludwigii]|uniref:hypothetical protein n=1 Tax=Enterobacter ludwigii TaxID=299767 RepID=UPI003D233E21
MHLDIWRNTAAELVNGNYFTGFTGTGLVDNIPLKQASLPERFYNSQLQLSYQTTPARIGDSQQAIVVSSFSISMG